VGQYGDSKGRGRKSREGEGALDGGREARRPPLASLCCCCCCCCFLALVFFSGLVEPARVLPGVVVALDDHEVVGAVSRFGSVAEEVCEVLGGFRV
jgi:hypothetical protein